MILPPDASAERPRPDNTLIKALARAFRWKRMLESGEFTDRLFGLRKRAA